MDMWTGYNKQVIKDVCYNCSSPISKQSYSYIGLMQYRLPAEKVYCECYGNKGFYFATKAKTHARLIEIAVRDEHKGQGIGESLLYRLLSRMKADGIFKLTFRTPINESAQYFWLKQGAKIIDIKGNDYVMELIFR